MYWLCYPYPYHLSHVKYTHRIFCLSNLRPFFLVFISNQVATIKIKVTPECLLSWLVSVGLFLRALVFTWPTSSPSLASSCKVNLIWLSRESGANIHLLTISVTCLAYHVVVVVISDNDWMVVVSDSRQTTTHQNRTFFCFFFSLTE